MRTDRLEPVFVEEIPGQLQPGSLYVSTAFATALHLCACGCGHEVVTPFHPTRWSMSYNGESVTLRPSVGNWSLACRSHYFIDHNEVVWAATWSEDEIRAVKARDLADTQAFFAPVDERDEPAERQPPARERQLVRLWRRVRRH